MSKLRKHLASLVSGLSWSLCHPGDFTAAFLSWPRWGGCCSGWSSSPRDKHSPDTGQRRGSLFPGMDSRSDRQRCPGWASKLVALCVFWCHLVIFPFVHSMHVPAGACHISEMPPHGQVCCRWPPAQPRGIPVKDSAQLGPVCRQMQSTRSQRAFVVHGIAPPGLGLVLTHLNFALKFWAILLFVLPFFLASFWTLLKFSASDSWQGSHLRQQVIWVSGWRSF